MKQIFTVFAALVLITVHFTAAQSAKKFTTEQSMITFATKNFLASFKSDNNGVLESALRLTAGMKMRYPEADMTELIKAMSLVKKNHKDGAIRYKAFVAISVCENPEWYSELMSHWTENGDQFFRSASTLMNERMLTSAY